MEEQLKESNIMLTIHQPLLNHLRVKQHNIRWQQTLDFPIEEQQLEKLLLLVIQNSIKQLLIHHPIQAD